MRIVGPLHQRYHVRVKVSQYQGASVRVQAWSNGVESRYDIPS